eukprot:XP_014036088.1 PREDICTED: LYR motif-containing protein 4B-like [Salmo salar]
MKESKKFSSYNYRMYTLRRVQDAFRANRSVEDPKTVEQLLNQGRDNLDIIQRQEVMAGTYEGLCDGILGYISCVGAMKP